MSRTEPLNDFDERAVSAAEADLERLLSIQPSAEFAAKVRIRIEAEKTRRPWRWAHVGLIAAAAAALVIVVTLRTGSKVDEGSTPFSTQNHDDIVLKAQKENPPAVVAPVAPASHAAAPPVAHAVTVQPAPEIIIDPAMTDAIRRLALGTKNTTLDASNGESIAADAQSAALPVAEPLNVPELVLGPADPNGGQ
jgi:hypothetical protein